MSDSKKTPDSPKTDKKQSEKKSADKATTEESWFIEEETRTYLKELFKRLPGEVFLELYSDPGRNEEYAEYCRKFIRDLVKVSDKIHFTDHRTLDEGRAKELEIKESPTLLIQPGKYNIRFAGAPAGEEARAFIETLVMVSTGNPALSDLSQEILDRLDEDREVKVFVAPTCPYCPGQVINAVKAAIAKPEYVKMMLIEVGENPDLAREYNAGSLPMTVFNRVLTTYGLEPEERFMYELVALESAEDLAKRSGHGESASPVTSDYKDVVILGAGPAGLTAAIYAARAGLSTIALECVNTGGQVAVTPTVENYTGFPSISGSDLTKIMTRHAREYTEIREYEGVEEIKVGKLIEVHTGKTVFSCRALVIASGAEWRDLGVPGEEKFQGRGISHCATCDGYLYREKNVYVIGGGNTALTDALYLKNIGVNVTVVHRRSTFRAEEHLIKALEHEKIPVLWNTVVTSFHGKTTFEGVNIKDLTTDKEDFHKCDAVFLAIGEIANSELARQLGVRTDPDGSITVDRNMRTSIPRIYAAGDVTGGVRQIVTAVGEGATAAMSAFEDIARARTEEDQG